MEWFLIHFRMDKIRYWEKTSLVKSAQTCVEMHKELQRELIAACFAESGNHPLSILSCSGWGIGVEPAPRVVQVQEWLSQSKEPELVSSGPALQGDNSRAITWDSQSQQPIYTSGCPAAPGGGLPPLMM